MGHKSDEVGFESACLFQRQSSCLLLMQFILKPQSLFQGAAEMYRLTARSEIGGERPETGDRFRGVDGTVDVLARATETVPTK